MLVLEMLQRLERLLNNEIGIWTGDGTIEGDANLTWSGTQLNVGGTYHK